MRADGTPLQFDGLWDLLPQDAESFSPAGTADEEHGLFGSLLRIKIIGQASF
jgi:hypothetical protein